MVGSYNDTGSQHERYGLHPGTQALLQEIEALKELLDPKLWAKKTFGASQLKDIGRMGRAVKAATQMAENASGSSPSHMQTWKDVIALYRWLDEEEVTSSRADAAPLATDRRTDRDEVC